MTPPLLTPAYTFRGNFRRSSAAGARSPCFKGAYGGPHLPFSPCGEATEVPRLYQDLGPGTWMSDYQSSLKESAGLASDANRVAWSPAQRADRNNLILQSSFQNCPSHQQRAPSTSSPKTLQEPTIG